MSRNASLTCCPDYFSDKKENAIMKIIPFKQTKRYLPLRDMAPSQTYPMHIIKKKRVLSDLNFVLEHL